MIGAGFRVWLERVFFGLAELSALSTPGYTVVVLAQKPYPDAVPIAGLLAIIAGSISLASFRAGSPSVGDWPRRGELTSMPFRIVFFSLVFVAASLGVAVVSVALGTLWITLFGSVVQVFGMAVFPTVYHAIYGQPVRNPAQRV
ncbi:MAG: hypothetical protein ACOCR6_00135 [archaeon]